jgi:hypothetical protein
MFWIEAAQTVVTYETTRCTKCTMLMVGNLTIKSGPRKF